MRILNVAGARPNFMKIAPIMEAIERRSHMSGFIVHTGQHYDDRMSQIFFDELQIPAPTINLEVGPGDRDAQIKRIADRFDPVVRNTKPDAVVVVGDVNSTVACGTVAGRHGIPVIHVEAGLRSFDTHMPEEINRIETDRLSDLLFVTEPSGMKNLENEGVQGRAFHVGNVMIDSLAKHLDSARNRRVHETLGLISDRFVVGTFHRPSNVDSKERLANVVAILMHVAKEHLVVLPLHPRTRASLELHDLYPCLARHPNVRLVEPLGYLDFISLVDRAALVVTDSGGIQEETTFLRIPCITMRDNTERPITVEIGSNVLAGTHPSDVMAAVDRVLTSPRAKCTIPELWDGRSAERIVDIIDRELG